MGGRGTFAAGNNVAYTYETVGKIEGVKVLFGKPGTGLHDLPAEAHSSNMYIKLHKDGTLNMLRIYDDEHYLSAEIAYHPEPDLTKNRESVLHIHYYDHNFNRTKAAYLTREIYEKYKKYLVGRNWYD
jgi:hypothetical protein